MPKPSPSQTSWLDRPVFPNLKLTWESALIGLLLLAGIVTRFYGLGDRVMSHDETTHVVFSWNLAQGDGYTHDPLSHGPFQFHTLALTYFLFGDSDFTARAPHALFGVLTILFIWWGFRRYLGRIGALIAAFLYLISPYMLYYGRYARNEVFVGLFGLVMIWGILRYLDRGDKKYMFITTAAFALHFATKETSFIYMAQALIFLGLLFLVRIIRRPWTENNVDLPRFLGNLVLAGVAFVLAIVARFLDLTFSFALLAGGGALAFLISLYFLLAGFGLKQLRTERSFGLLAILLSLVVPALGGLILVTVGGLTGLDLGYTNLKSIVFGMDWGQLFASPNLGPILIATGVLVLLVLVSMLIGWLWNFKTWLANIGLFALIFFPLFTTMFTNPVLGTFSGLIGSLAYWLEQQPVQRGSQPWYFYWAVQLPMYEYLAALGTVLAGAVGLGIWRRDRQVESKPLPPGRNLLPAESRRLALTLFAFWAATALVAYSIAGEKMPWLTFHIALPMIMLAGWALGWVIKHVEWQRFANWRNVAVVGAMMTAMLSFLSLLGTLLGSHMPFQGMQQAQLQDTLRFVFTLIVCVAAIAVTVRLTLTEKWPSGQPTRVAILIAFTGLAFLTAHAAFRASYVNYDSAREYLVYAHMAPGPKQVMERLEELSLQLTDGLDIQVAYDNETNYPLWWYLRNYPNKVYYAENPSLSLRDMPVIIVGDLNYGKIEPIVRDDYYMFQVQRIWWPNQDYFEFQQSSIANAYSAETGLPATDLSFTDYLQRVWAKLTGSIDSPAEREALWQVWLNADFDDYFTNNGRDTSPTAWSPAHSMRMYVRKDIANQVWDLGAPPVVAEPDPYEGFHVALSANIITGDTGGEEGFFDGPRGLAVAPDGSVYIADSFNHRIQHLAADGAFISEWGTEGDVAATDDPGGQFNEPWGVAVSPDGRFVYVADTWNYRIQKFTASGEFVTAWGATPETGSLYGPRDVAVAADGNVLVSDTGNKRILVYDNVGNFVSQIGGSGFDLGQFEEPVGLAMDRENNLLYVADTWNLRIQVLSYADGILTPLRSWDVQSWEGQSITNKPYMALGDDGRLYVTDPDLGRVLVFESDGTFVSFFGGFEEGTVNLGIAQGIAADGSGGLWVSDSLTNRLFHFLIQ